MTDLATRYGRPARGRRRWWIAAGAVVLAVALGWGTWISLTVGDPKLSWEDFGYRTSATAVDVTFSVTFNHSVADDAYAVCTLQAQNALHTEVGLRNDVRVGPASHRTVRVTARVPTGEPAVTGLVKACALA